VISVIIPAYNEEKYLERTLLSIREQTIDAEIIVVANGCTDNTVNIAKRYAHRLFSVNKSCTSTARNIGAQFARYDVLVFLDADTRLAVNSLEEIQNQFGADDVVATLKAYPNESKFIYRILNVGKNTLHQLNIWKGMSGVLITRKALFYNVQGFNSNLHISEIHDYIKKVGSFGAYKVIKDTHVITSTRRYEKWGLIRTLFFWLFNRWRPLKVEYEAVR
jgi:glycosyltransferase involved in cell wall biosynthesis